MCMCVLGVRGDGGGGGGGMEAGRHGTGYNIILDEEHLP